MRWTARKQQERRSREEEEEEERKKKKKKKKRRTRTRTKKNKRQTAVAQPIKTSTAAAKGAAAHHHHCICCLLGVLARARCELQIALRCAHGLGSISEGRCNGKRTGMRDATGGCEGEQKDRQKADGSVVLVWCDVAWCV